MKHQYFGDVNDYRKYGLLRALSQGSGLAVGVCWLLTADDGRSDGEFRTYLWQPKKWRKHDPELYEALQRLNDPVVNRSVYHAGSWALVPGAQYFPALLEDALSAREAYFRNAWGALSACPLIFFDPDNGLEVGSVRRGGKQSRKYLYWREVEETYGRGHSVVVYQHFPRQERAGYTARLAKEAATRLGAPRVDTFATAHVLFLFVPRPEHAAGLERAHDLILARWAGQIEGRADVVD